MIRHIVLLKFNSRLIHDEIKNVFKSLEKLCIPIPEILSFTWGPYHSNEGLNRDFTHGFVMDFENEKERDYYLEHPEHKRVANEVILPALEDGVASVIAFDYHFSK